MESGRSRKATGEWRIVSIAMLSAFLASCTTHGDTRLNIASPSYAPGVAGVMEQAADEASNALSSGATATPIVPAGGVQTQAAASDASTGSASISAEGDTQLPQQIAYLPTSNPVSKFPAIPSAVPQEADGALASSTQAETPPGTTATTAAGQAANAAPVPTPSPAQSSEAAAVENAVYVTATDPQQPIIPIEPKKRGFLSSLFGTPPAAAAPSPARKPTPIIELASTEPAKPIVRASLGGGDDSDGDFALPGVRQTALFEIKRKSGLDDDSDVDLHEDEEAPVRMASAAGLARLAPNGLLTQTDNVDVACLKPSLVRVLKTVEQKYGRKIVVTSGYRSPSHNRRARGAKNSLHMYCAAADVQVEGISKWELAKFVRAMPGRGGVGTYCHTESVHIDVGPERDWNWRCRRRKG